MTALPPLALLLLLAAPTRGDVSALIGIGAGVSGMSLATLSLRDHWGREDGWSWGWTRHDWMLEGEGDALMAADMLTTLDIGGQRYVHEGNPLLGPHPSGRAVVGYFALLGAGRLLVSALLPGRLRPAWQALSITVSAGMVGQNVTNGLSLRIPLG